MRAFARTRPLTLFLLVTFGFSWTLWALMILSQRGLLPFTVPTHWSGSFGPTLGALAVIGLADGRAGLRALLARLGRWRAGAGVWLAALLLIVVSDGLGLALFAALRGELPALQPFSAWGSLALYAPIILVIGGPLGEELGWRGFLQPYLQARMTPLAASLVVGVVWALWHAPLPWLSGAAQQGHSPFVFALAVLPMAFIFAWILNASNGSLLLPLVLHTSINTFSYLVEPRVLAGISGDPLARGCSIAASWLIALALVLVDRARFLAGPATAHEAVDQAA